MKKKIVRKTRKTAVVSEDLTIGRLSLKVMDCMIELRSQSQAMQNLFQGFHKLIEDVNSANGKLAQKYDMLEQKLHEVEKLVIGKAGEKGYTGDVN